MVFVVSKIFFSAKDPIQLAFGHCSGLWVSCNSVVPLPAQSHVPNMPVWHRHLWPVFLWPPLRISRHLPPPCHFWVLRWVCQQLVEQSTTLQHRSHKVIMTKSIVAALSLWSPIVNLLLQLLRRLRCSSFNLPVAAMQLESVSQIVLALRKQQEQTILPGSAVAQANFLIVGIRSVILRTIR